MGRSRFVTAAAVTFFVAVSYTQAAVAQQRSKSSNRQPQGWWQNEKVQTELGLSGQQVSAIAGIEEQHRGAMREHRQAQQQAYRQMILLLTDVSPSEEEIEKGRQTIEQAWMESARQTVDHWIKLRDELTTEQWQKLPQVAPRALQLGGFRTRAMGNVTVGEQSD